MNGGLIIGAIGLGFVAMATTMVIIDNCIEKKDSKRWISIQQHIEDLSKYVTPDDRDKKNAFDFEELTRCIMSNRSPGKYIDFDIKLKALAGEKNG